MRLPPHQFQNQHYQSYHYKKQLFQKLLHYKFFHLLLIFALIFTMIQSLLLRKEGSDSKTYAKEQLENLKKGRHFQEFVLRKQIKLKKYGADIFVRDGILVSQWYLYKALFASVAGVITFVLSVKVFHADAGYIITAAVTAFAWFFLDLYPHSIHLCDYKKQYPYPKEQANQDASSS